MNLARLFSGCFKALGRDTHWPDYFDLSTKGFRQSFLTIPLSLPFFYVCAAALHKQQVAVLSQSPEAPAVMPGLISPAPFVLIFLTFGFSFSALAYFLARMFQKDEVFKSWVVVRHWTFFFLAFIVSVLLGASYLGVIPFAFVLPFIFMIYLGTLAVDIRYAQKIAGFEWGAAILAGCMITALGLMVVLIGVNGLAG